MRSPTVAVIHTSPAVVLAQASMARVLPRLAPEQQARCLVSPELAVASVAKALGTH